MTIVAAGRRAVLDVGAERYSLRMAQPRHQAVLGEGCLDLSPKSFLPSSLDSSSLWVAKNPDFKTPSFWCSGMKILVRIGYRLLSFNCIKPSDTDPYNHSRSA